MNAPSKTERLRNTSALFARVSRDSERVVVPINDSALGKNTALPAFYCVHDITGGALSDFVALAQRLETTARFYGIQAPPKKMEEADFGKSIESMADYYVEALSKFQPQGQLLLGGYCAGAIVALEIAKKFRDKGRDVALLIALDAVPENTSAELRPWNPSYLVALARNLPAWFIYGGLKKQKDSHSLLRRISSNAIALGRIAMGRRPTQRLDGGYDISDSMSLSRYPPEQRSFINRFYEACFAYFPQQYSGDVVVYEANVTPVLYLPQIGNRWRSIAAGCVIVGVPGTHLRMLHEPQVSEIASDLQRRIASPPLKPSTLAGSLELN